MNINAIIVRSSDSITQNVTYNTGTPIINVIITEGVYLKNPFQNFLLRIIFLIKNLLNININSDNTVIVINAKIFITFDFKLMLISVHDGNLLFIRCKNILFPEWWFSIVDIVAILTVRDNLSRTVK